MDADVYLSRPSFALRDAYVSFHAEWVSTGERMVPWVISRSPADFQGMMEFLQNDETRVAEGRVPNSTYWLVAGDRVVGVSNIRHRLNERLLRSGGHIGYGIRPSARRKGYATKLLALSLERARELGLERVLVCCGQGNVGSEKTIRKNGGVQDESCVDDGEIVLRFWIPL